ncbi:hypothetical protein Rt10032_c12g4680 [Rhodotorula toruloides]|uniref:Uncharacterized protein n=1 Tax=Rhodotorula toruloides TaxID=5286 RepID=A0A511KJX3_RHOTO|nr:hypothetical protein Rt10032_c12g4680 [Rhodotorula toruloides]
MGETEAGEYGVELIARTLRRTVDFEGAEAQFANAVRSLVRLVHIELPNEQQAKPADAVQLLVVQAAQQPPTPPAEQGAAASSHTPAPGYDASATKGKGRALDPTEPTADELRCSPSPSPEAAQDEIPKLAASRAAEPSASRAQLEEEAKMDLPAPLVNRALTPRLSQRTPVGSANLILRNFCDIPLVAAQPAPASGLVFFADMDLTFTRDQMGKEGYTMIGKGGKKDGPFTLAHHWLAFKMDKNLCGVNGRLAAPGEPLVIISSQERLDKIAGAVSRSHRPDKPYDGVHVFISRLETIGLYCGRH